MMEDLAASPFLVPIQLSASACGGVALPSVFEYPDASDVAAADDLSHVFGSPPRQSFQLLLRGGEDPVLKADPDAAAPQPRRRTSSRLAKGVDGYVTASVLVSAAKPTTREKRAAPSSDDALTTSRKPSRGAATAGGAALLLQDQEDAQQQRQQQQPPKRPKRKASYLARKEEKETLAQHIEQLKKQLAALKYEAAAGSGTRAQKQMRKRRANDVLADAITQQQLTIAGLRAMLSEHTTLQTRGPMETLIRLSSDRQQRDATLLRLKSRKLQEARTFLAERSRGIDITKRYSEEELFETPDGDLCTLRFDVIPLRRAKSVRAVFDAMLFYISNIEITISETIGYLTIREDDDSSDANVSQHRLVMAIGPSIQVESNSVAFSEFSTDGLDGLDGLDAGRGHGVVATDFVDEDALYPYQPQSRVRREVTAMMMVSPQMVRTNKERASAGGSGDQDAGGDDDEELVVSLRRYALTRMRRTSLPIPSSALEEIRDHYSRFSDELAKVLRANAANLGGAVL